jgi:hypothetical protein
MVNQKLISIIEKNLEDLAKTWFDEAVKSEIMTTYHHFKDEQNYKRGKAVYENLLKWLKEGALHEEVEKYFEKVGAIRLNEGFPLSEVHYALYLSKKIFWGFVDWRDAISGSFQSSTTTQIMALLNDYFDLGNFYITRGYFKELITKLDEDKKFSKEEIKNLLTQSSVDWDNVNEDEITWRHV